MSGRSAYARKKVTDPKKTGSRGRAKSAASADQDDVSFSDFPIPIPQGPIPVGTGVGTTNARFLKFADLPRDAAGNTLVGLPNASSASIHSRQSGSSGDTPRGGTRGGSSIGSHEQYGYARPRRPTLKTEDVSGIEKSGLRNILDKKSENVRKGLAKTFTFRKRDKGLGGSEKMPDYRPESAATVRQNASYSNHASMIADQHVVDALGPPADVYPQSNSRTYEPAADPWDGNSPLLYPPPPPTAQLPPIPPHFSTAPPVRRWIGFGRPVQRWNKLRKDPELWDPSGDVLVYLCHREQHPKPNPSLRLSSHIIEATESRYLITLLREGSTEEEFGTMPSPIGGPSMLRGRNYPMMADGYGGRVGDSGSAASDDADLIDAEGQISYELYFPAPTNMSRVDQLRYHIATRNVFALLYHTSIAGLSLHQALSDLHTRLSVYMPPESDNVVTIIDYLQARGLDDVRNDAETAVSILAWAEGPKVRWDEGWRESFVHCAGMYYELERCVDFKSLSPITRGLLDRASLETQVRVHQAQDRLGDFQYADMWPPVETSASASARSAADRLRKFLMAHYSSVFGCWPLSLGAQSRAGSPPSAADSETELEEIWLSRAVTQQLQRDFGALYDYLVNRDIVWDGSEMRSSRKWMMVSESGNRAFDADADNLPMTDILIEFDNRQHFPHIPHPHPLVPDSIPPVVEPAKADGGGMFKSSGKKNGAGTTNGKATAGAKGGHLDRRVRLAYSESTNMAILGPDFAQSDLVDSFVKFERVDCIGEVDPAVARRGRWVLIYGVLQTLASISVDGPMVRFRDGVPYHLSPRLRGTKTPPWRTGGAPDSPEEASHELSHCWTAPRTWNGSNPSQVGSSGTDSEAESLHNSPLVGNHENFPVHASWQRSMPPPPPSVTSTARSSTVGYYTPGSRSIRSGSSTAQFSVAGSTISDSDAASSVRTPASSVRSGGGLRRLRSKENMRAGVGFGGFPRGAASFGGIEPVDEVDDYNNGSSNGTQGSRTNGTMSAAAPVQLSLPGGIPSSGGFLGLEDIGRERGSSQARSPNRSADAEQRRTGSRGRHGGGSRKEGRVLNGSDKAELDDMPPLIKDFDDESMGGKF